MYTFNKKRKLFSSFVQFSKFIGNRTQNVLRTRPNWKILRRLGENREIQIKIKCTVFVFIFLNPPTFYDKPTLDINRFLYAQ